MNSERHTRRSFLQGEAVSRELADRVVRVDDPAAVLADVDQLAHPVERFFRLMRPDLRRRRWGNQSTSLLQEGIQLRQKSL